ncbi:MAG: alpha/beta hydrolase [Ruminococcaceae bacterium]|nr:alpha/beta hydrolase [Oscillospiraceae bacterium]
MINRIVKKIGNSAIKSDVGRLDLTRLVKDVTEINDISYADDNDPGHKIDIYIKKDGKIKPILIDIHGGGFITEDKAMTRLWGNYMADLGFVVFELNFRLAYPEVTVFDQIEDIDKGVRYVLEIADQYECDRNELYIAGHSSGGVQAFAECMLSLSPEMLKDFGLKERDYRYKGLITDCGLMHFYKSSIAYWGMRKMVFPKGYKQDKRYKYLTVTGNGYLTALPKVALITNRKDVLRKMTYFFDGVLKDNGVPHRLYDGGKDGHTGIIFYPYREENIKTMKEIRDYLLND